MRMVTPSLFKPRCGATGRLFGSLKNYEISCIIKNASITSLETAMVHEQCTVVHGSPFLFFDLRGDATDKLAGIGKNVNDESCSNRRALQIDHELRNPKRSSPFLFFYGGNREKT